MSKTSVKIKDNMRTYEEAESSFRDMSRTPDLPGISSCRHHLNSNAAGVEKTELILLEKQVSARPAAEDDQISIESLNESVDEDPGETMSPQEHTEQAKGIIEQQVDGDVIIEGEHHAVLIANESWNGQGIRQTFKKGIRTTSTSKNHKIGVINDKDSSESYHRVRAPIYKLFST